MKYFFITLIVLNTACTPPSSRIEMVTTTQSTPWSEENRVQHTTSLTKTDLVVETSRTLQAIEGFGTCFNELGWTSLSRLSDADREGIMKELFKPGAGANFTICRMPLGANDFSRDWYSYNESEGDFEMLDFSIDNDLETLVPYIKNALKYHPDLKVWASPWSPPQWMKYNKHYAAKSVLGDSEFHSDDLGIDWRGIDNGLSPDKQGKEGTDMFIQEPRYFEAYAKYFSRFIEAYRAQGINISMVMPQNEFNSTQIFPSCTWTAGGLSRFLGDYLGPAMEKRDVEIMFGTMERPTEALVDTILTHPKAGKYMTGVGFQWGGKRAIPGIHQRYPEMKLYQTEQECGNGKNDWKNCKYSWELMKHYLQNGTNAYMYWNTSLDEGGISTWGWKQNSLVSIDTVSNTFRYNHEYYLLKHVSHFVQPGARLLETSGSFDNLLAFKNPDSSVILVVQNDQKEDREIGINIDGALFLAHLKGDAFSSIQMKKHQL